MKKLLSLYGLLSLCFLPSIAQVSFEQRIELGSEKGYEDEKIYSFGEAGFILRAKNEQISRTNNTWKFTLFDTDLKTIDSTLSFPPRKQVLAATYRDKEQMYSFYQSKNGKFSLETLQISPFKLQSIKGKIPPKTKIRQMVRLQDVVFLLGETKKDPFLCSINWKTGQQRILNIGPEYGIFGDIKLQKFQVLENSEEVLVFIKANLHKKRNDMYFLSLNKQGETGSLSYLSEGVKQNIIDVSASKVSKDTYMLSGTYSATHTNISEGLFFGQIKEEQVPQINFYKFIDLHNFLSYLPQKRLTKLEKKIKRKEKAGKEFSPDYRIASHEIIPVDDGYLYIGEAYYSTYDCDEIITTDPDGVSSIIPTYTFAGYQYTHAVIAKFDKNQQLLWDESFTMWPSYKPFGVRRFISIAEKNPEQLKLIFASHKNIHTKSISLSDPEEQFTERETFKTSFEGDKSKRTFSNIDFWYDNYFIAFGNQKIKNKANEDSPKKRKVFFVSKIGFE